MVGGSLRVLQASSTTKTGRHDLAEILAESSVKTPQKKAYLSKINSLGNYKRVISLCYVTGRQFVILDLPLLFETGNLVPYSSYIIVVSW